MAERVLPALPPSDPASLAQNRFDPNYNTRAASFWQGNQVIHIEDKPMQKCNHYFETIPNGVKCKKCHFGLNANLKIQDGNLLINGKPFEF